MKYNIDELSPERCSKIDAEQKKLLDECDGKMEVVRRCPYCKHEIVVAMQGQHGYSKYKCEKCKKTVIFPPLSFRMASY